MTNLISTEPAGRTSIYIGLMSGTSLDGVDGVLVQLPEHHGDAMHLLGSAHQVFSDELKQQALALQQTGDNEIHREAMLANQLAHSYADCVAQLRAQCPDLPLHAIQAIGVHGQTIRHRPDCAYTRQTNNPALLAELCGIDVIADFRSRDIAAGGQGAPLVPAFHRAMFGQAGECRVVVNIGGMSNISILHADGHTSGFDTGPGNVLMDAWVYQHLGKAYDADGAWAASGKVNDALLTRLGDEAFLHQAPPKSTGRDLFHLAWLKNKLIDFSEVAAQDVQATLCALTARTIVDAILSYAPQCTGVFVCGGGAYNRCLLNAINDYLKDGSSEVTVQSSHHLGIAPHHVEALAFAWLARAFVIRQTGNLSEVTGAKGTRILGALYPA